MRFFRWFGRTTIISLLPGEKREVTATYRTQELGRLSRQWKSAVGM